KKIENIWFYHKWHMLAGLLAIAALFVGIRSCVQRDEPDLFVLYAHDKSVNAIQTRQLEEWFEEKVNWADPQLEGEVTVISTTNTDQWTGYSSTAMVTQVTSGEGVLYVVTEDIYQLLHDNGVLEDLTPYVGESQYLDKDRYYLSASGVLDAPLFANDEMDYYLCLRKVKGTSFEGVERYEKQLELSKKILGQFADSEKE
ncbi:MAG: hypothetical protein IJN82_00190, partial [Clostridia bacterium]|nr:hypothetical protein [Clostridia bacterium]